MTQKLTRLCILSAFILSSCAAARTGGQILSAPVKLGAKTVEYTGKGVYGTSKLAGQGVYETGKLAGKGVMAAGKSVYYIGSTPVYIADGVLERSAQVLRVTKLATDISGNVTRSYVDIQAAQLNGELLKYRGAKNVLEIAVDVLR